MIKSRFHSKEAKKYKEKIIIGIREQGLEPHTEIDRSWTETFLKSWDRNP